MKYCEFFDKNTNMGAFWRTFNPTFGRKKRVLPVPVFALLSNKPTADILDKIGDTSFSQLTDKPERDLYEFTCKPDDVTELKINPSLSGS